MVLGERNPLLANRSGARWNPPETAALYASLDRETVIFFIHADRLIRAPVSMGVGK